MRKGEMSPNAFEALLIVLKDNKRFLDINHIVVKAGLTMHSRINKQRENMNDDGQYMWHEI
jgi:hypothetical protein